MSSQTVHKGLEGVVIDESELSRVFGAEGRLVFRGYDVEDVAEHGDFEETLYLMWYGQLPTHSEYEAFRSALAEQRDLPDRITDTMLPTCAELNHHPMSTLQSAVSMLAGADPNTDADFESDREAVVAIGTSIVAKVATITAAYHRVRDGLEPVAPRDDLGHAANFLYMLHGEEQPEPFVEAMDTALQLHVDHGTNASTFTTRVVASTLANPYEAIAAGIGALSGPLHGGANQDVLVMLEDLDESGLPLEEWVDQRLAGDDVVYGWGHRVYDVKDPRAKILQADAQRLVEGDVGETKWFELARDVEQYLDSETDFAEKGIAPNVDFYSGTVYTQMGIPTDLYTNLFTMSRAGGWIAHVLEQYENNRIIRPRVEYVGETDRPWTSMDERAPDGSR